MGFARKLKRKTMVVQRKQFMKDFKKAMANFKLQVKCSECGRYPREGENIDDWKINKNSENLKNQNNQLKNQKTSFGGLRCGDG